MKTEFTSQEELIKTWVTANATAKEAEEQIKLCKLNAVDINIPLGSKLFEDWGVVMKSRRELSIPLELAKEILGDMYVNAIKIDKKQFEECVLQLLSEEELKELQKRYVETGNTEFFQLQKIK